MNASEKIFPTHRDSLDTLAFNMPDRNSGAEGQCVRDRLKFGGENVACAHGRRKQQHDAVSGAKIEPTLKIQSTDDSDDRRNSPKFIPRCAEREVCNTKMTKTHELLSALNSRNLWKT